MAVVFDHQSQAVVDFADRLRQRALGNADDQRVLSDLPNRVISFGIIFSESDAEASRRGIRSIFRPSACVVRFEVRREDYERLELAIIPSFWLYFERDDQPPAQIGEMWDGEGVFHPWPERPSPQGFTTTPLSPGAPSSYVRARYAQTFRGSPAQLASITLDEDLRQFRQSRQQLGRSPEWRGQLCVTAHDKPDRGTIELTVSVVNTYRYQRRRGEPAWFDVRLRIETNTPVQPVYCPLLDGYPAHVQTLNCALATDRSRFPTDHGARIEVEQIALALRMRQQMITIEGLPFAEATGEHIIAAVRAFAGEAQPEHANALRQAVERLQGNPNACAALDIVATTLGRAQPRDRLWYRHQAAILILGAARYLEGGNTLEPLVINVPTAGGKTEAFAAVALWTVAYERLAHNRLGVAIVKYPTTMLSTDQARRLAHLVMHFDAVMAEKLGLHDDRGLGLFFGSDPQRGTREVDPTELLGNTCPECDSPWRTSTVEGRQQLICTRNPTHSVMVAIRDQIFPRPPSLIAATIDKFVSKARKTEIGCLFGGRLYWCPHSCQFTASRECYDESNHRYCQEEPAREQPLLTTLVLDEAHLLREETGSLDAQFETHYLEMARELGGRYPIVIVSTATIAQVPEHCRQLGLGSPQIFPGEGRENDAVYYRRSDREVQHAVLGCVPRGRAIAWALPQLYGQYLSVEESAPARFRPTDPSQRLRPPLIYCNSYATRDQVVNSLRQQIAPPRRARGLRLEVEEFSRRRFNQEGVRDILRKLETEMLDAIVTTNIASVGVDLGQLNGILYFGMPSNIAEFIQSMNRVGRRSPAIACLVLNPYLERDMAFYSYLELFLAYPERLVETVPLNRWARRAINLTFDAIALAQIQHIWTPRVMPAGVDLRRAQRTRWARGFREARGRELNENSVTILLRDTYRASDDPSGVYPRRVTSLWNAMAANICNYTPTRQRQAGRRTDDNWISDTPQLQVMWRLRAPEPEGQLEPSLTARALITAGARAIFAADIDLDFGQRINDQA